MTLQSNADVQTLLAREGSSAAQTLRMIYEALRATYGPQHWWPAQTSIETVVGAYLTQNTAWRNVERSIDNLRAAGVLSVDGLRAIGIEELQALIRPSGYMVRKAMAIKAWIALLDREYGGSMQGLAETPTPAVREVLLDLPGVGPETADAILLYALGRPVMVVDEYLRRVTTRHGLIDEAARYGDLQSLAMAAFAGEPGATLREHYNEFHALIVEVGKQHCGGVPRCDGCPLNLARFGPPAIPAAEPRVPGKHQAGRRG